MLTLTSKQKKIIRQHQAIHLLKAYLDVTEKKQAKMADLYIQAQTSFKECIAADSDVGTRMLLSTTKLCGTV
jgi:predicted DNA-binding protein YlxM (UPF0122 family)